MDAFIFFVALALIFTVSLALARRKARRRNQTWQVVAESLGLALLQSDLWTAPQLEGELDGVKLHATIEMEDSGESTNHFIRVRAAVPVILPEGLTLYREGVFQRLGKAMGSEDIQVGDPELDASFIIKGQNTHQIVRLLRVPLVRHTLLAAYRHCNSLRIEQDAVTIRESGGSPSPADLASYLRTCVAVAQALAQGRKEVDAAPKQLPAPQPPARPQPAPSDRSDWW